MTGARVRHAKGYGMAAGAAAAIARAFRLLTAVLLVVLVGCSERVAGVPVKARAADHADINQMDTGAYPTAPTHIFGPAGDDRVMQGVLEAHRMADFVVGPWQVQGTLRRRPTLDWAIRTGPIATAADVAASLARPFSDIAAKHQFIAGFSSLRVAPPNGSSQLGFANAVLRFPDAAAAAAAAVEMASANPTVPGASLPEPATIYGHPEAIATRYILADGSQAIESFTPHGPYLLYQWGYSTHDLGPSYAETLVPAFLTEQEPRIDQFVPTDLNKTGHASGGSLGASAGCDPARRGRPRTRPHRRSVATHRLAALRSRPLSGNPCAASRRH